MIGSILHTTWKTFFHSCGSVREILDDMIEAGVDILNPVQTSAYGMNPESLKEKYGDKVTFWGGGIDTQKTLPHGSSDEIVEEVKERVKILGKGGGFVFAAIHNIQPDVPEKNLLTLFETLKKER